MQEHRIHFSFRTAESVTALAAEDRELIEAAIQALDKSYAPYSRFRVGAAARLAGGQIISDGNQENASYPLCLCAEQTLTGAIRSIDPSAVIEVMAITAYAEDGRPLPPVAPCGGCRQILAEWEDRQGQSIRILLKGTYPKVVEISSCSELLPLTFHGSFLPGQPTVSNPESADWQ